MSRYILINIIILSIPLLLSFDRRVRYYRKLHLTGFSILIISSLFILWDIIASGRGDWYFNSQFISSFSFLHLPLGEWMFFFTVPYSCLFLYETYRTYIPERRIHINPLIFYILALISIVSGIMLIGKVYTSTVLLVTGFVFILNTLCFRDLTEDLRYWIYIASTMVLFIIFNYFLTSMPIVMYNSNAITGFRFLTIPLEDFLYNYSLLTLYAGIFLITGKRWARTE